MRRLSSLTLARDSPECLSQPSITGYLPALYSPNHWSSPYVTYILTKSSKRETSTQLHNVLSEVTEIPRFNPKLNAFHLELLFFVLFCLYLSIKSKTCKLFACEVRVRDLPSALRFMRMAEWDTDWRRVFRAICDPCLCDTPRESAPSSRLFYYTCARSKDQREHAFGQWVPLV